MIKLKEILQGKKQMLNEATYVKGKMNVLLVAIERTNPSIDDQELRWVSDRIEYWENEERVLSKSEMQIANLYWKKYNNK